MCKAVKAVVKPEKFNDSLKWIYDAIQARERERCATDPIGFTDENSNPPISMIEIPKRFTRLKMGHKAFCEARINSRTNSATMVDYFDSDGPRLKIFGMVADPTSDLAPWEIELS